MTGFKALEIEDGVECIAVDLDGVLAKWGDLSMAEYRPDAIGEFVPVMVERIKRWLAQGKEVAIFTARVHPMHVEEAEIARRAIEERCLKEFGKKLEVTCMKHPRMSEIWDDRAVTIERDTGRILTEGVKDDVDEPDAIGSLA
jgi:hypothetical protein